MINTEVKYSIEIIDKDLLIKVNDLMYEFKNKLLLEEVEAQISDKLETVVLNLETVKYINSMGLRFMLSLYKTANANNTKLVLENISEEIKQLIKITKLEEVLVSR